MGSFHFKPPLHMEDLQVVHSVANMNEEVIAGFTTRIDKFRTVLKNASIFCSFSPKRLKHVISQYCLLIWGTK